MATRRALIEEFYAAWIRRDWAAVASRLSPDLEVRTPIDRVASVQEYREKCWPYGEGLTSLAIQHYLEQGDLSMFTYRVTSRGKSFRVAEVFRFEGSLIREIQIYWGDLPK